MAHPECRLLGLGLAAILVLSHLIWKPPPFLTGLREAWPLCSPWEPQGLRLGCCFQVCTSTALPVRIWKYICAGW